MAKKKSKSSAKNSAPKSGRIDYRARLRDEMERLDEQRHEGSGSGFRMPEGLYVVNLVQWEDKMVTDKETKKPATVCTPHFKVVEVLECDDDNIDPDTLEGKIFRGSQITTEVKRQFSIGDAFRLAAAISGDEVDDIEDTADALETCAEEAAENQSALIEVRVAHRKSKDGSKTYSNAFINGPAETDDEPGDDEGDD